MKTGSYIGILLLLLFGLNACLDDHTSVGDKELSEITITAAHDTLTAYFGEEFVIDHLQVEQSGEELPLTYKWGYGSLNMNGDEIAGYPIRDSLRVISHDPQLRYTFRELGKYGLSLKVENGESIRFKYFVLQIDTEFSEGITILSRDEAGKGRLSFMKTLTKEDLSAGVEPSFRTDIMGVINPGIEMEDVTDMVQVESRLLVASGSTGRIYNMDARTFDVEGMTSFQGTYPTSSFRKFAGISAHNNMYILSDDKRAYVYDCVQDELVLTSYFEDVEVNASCCGNKPVFVNYRNSVLYSPASGGLYESAGKFAPFDIHAVCFIGTNLYVVSTMKNSPLQVYLASTPVTFPNPTVLQFYTSTEAIRIDRESICVGCSESKCIYYTYGNAIYCWKVDQKLPTEPYIVVPEGMEITTLSMNPEEKLLYVGLHEKNSANTLKGSLYVYDAQNRNLVSTYRHVADKPIRVIYKKRV
ncbi:MULTISPECIES: hypothetical protein [Butyricimonas]|uniref:hypothetical protein n=1 Tax=Butyricimonas TaxID=574697 RepID=UPI0007FB267F|nr:MULTISPECIES: hypothetical protein [Butyricimonas]